MANSEVKSKANTEANMQAVLPIDEKVVLDAICEMLIGRNAIIPVKEFCHMVNREQRTVYNYVEGNLSMPPECFAVLARETVRRGDYRIINFMLPDGMTVAKLEDVQTNKSLDDEYADDIELKGRVRTLYQQGRSKDALDLYRRHQSVIDSRIEKELLEGIANGR